jgi:hypothetical protein
MIRRLFTNSLTVFKRILGRLILGYFSQLGYRVAQQLMRILHKVLGFGYDSGLENEVTHFSKEVAKFNLTKNVILDVGANIGKWSKLVNDSIVGCEIHAFEPAKETFEILAKSILSFPNIHPHNYGCGE